jgi:hypothetical protein
VFRTYVLANGAGRSVPTSRFPGDLPPFTRLRDVAIANGSVVGVPGTNAVHLITIAASP